MLAAKVFAISSVVFLVASTAQTQTPRLAVTVSTMKADHFLAGHNLSGPGFEFYAGRPTSSFKGQFALHRLTAISPRFGRACGGMINPLTCPPAEALRDYTRLFMLTGGISQRLVERYGASLSVLANLRGGFINSDTRGTVSGRSLKANGLMGGAGVGLGASWMPRPSIPVALSASATAGMLKGFVPEALDSYEPFGSGRFDAHQVSVGLTWMRR